MKAKSNETFVVVCYGNAETYAESKRNSVIKKFTRYMMGCDPDSSEYDRYMSIVDDLRIGKKVCRDM